jgi:phenylalanine-4-hydroxylase
VLTGANDEAIYLRTTGPTALAFGEKQLDGHGKDYHADGFVSPIGNWRETTLREGEKARLEFESGIVVEGKIERLVRHADKLILISFSDCTAKLGIAFCSTRAGAPMTWPSASASRRL